MPVSSAARGPLALDLHGTAVTAALGPTNTGKTHSAIQRMLGHRTGMMGLPLRLLAREVYDRVVSARGPDVVALVTGEERITPPGARYWICTVESMPVDKAVHFVAIDEIQLCTHPTRGHIFTDRLLHARGMAETWLLGSDTMAPLIQQLLPTAELVRRPRLSKLRHKGPLKLTSLPPRSAVVAFGVTKVYELAERLRRRHGGAAVVLGALSPRTRNAQVALYQSGEVPYLVATDAIGMGLNLDVDHVAFAGITKFDGVSVRELRPAEVGQIAGRAGRYKKDGTFGALTDIGPMPADIVSAVTDHRFPPVRRLRWRNSDLAFHSPQHLLDSLERRPFDARFVRKLDALDHQALSALARMEHIRQAVRGPDATRLLWSVCQVPDYRNTMTEAHVRLLERVFGWVSSDAGTVPADELERARRRLDRVDGDIETLMARLSWIRTWTYISHRGGWVPDPTGWQARFRDVEDRLSDALHERLTERFVDRRTRMMGGVSSQRPEHPPQLEESGFVTVMGATVGQVRGFDFVPDPSGMPADEPGFERQVRRLLDGPVAARLAQVLVDDAELVVAADGTLRVEDVPLGVLSAGTDPLAPRLRVLRHDLLDPQQRAQLQARLETWTDSLVARVAGPLSRPAHTKLERAGRGVHFHLLQGLGSTPLSELSALLPDLTDIDRRHLARLSIRLGRHHAYALDLLSPAAVHARAVLWAVHHNLPVPQKLPVGASAPRLPGMTRPQVYALGYLLLGPRVVRQDIVERVSAWARKAERAGPFELEGPAIEWMGCPKADAPGVFSALGYRPLDDEGRRWSTPRPARRRRRR